MSIQINGKPLNEYIKEQQKKDGVMIVHKGTTRSRFGASIYNGAIVTLMGDKDVRYENADISIRLNGKEYRLTGNLVERIKNVWYVDGNKIDIPALPGKTNTKNSVDTVDRINEFLEDFGINVNAHVNKRTIHRSGFNIENDFSGVKTVVYGSDTKSSSKENRVIITGGSVNINRGGKTYTIKGNKIEKKDGRWFADGKAVEWDSIGGKYKDSNVVTVEINGNVHNLTTRSGDVTVNGHVDNISTTSGDVNCESATTVNTMSGDVHSKHIEGNARTMSGNIYG